MNPLLFFSNRTLLTALTSFIALGVGNAFADVVLVENSVAKTAIYAPAKMSPQLQEAVKDLALYLEKISGAKIEILSNAEPTHSLPILIGDVAAKKFGPPAKKSPHKQGWRLIVSNKGVGLLGESDESTGYAIYELLDRLGCRWYIPGDMGEVYPQQKTIRLPETDISEVPEIWSRGIWYADDAFKRRNRLTPLLVKTMHALEIADNYITAAQIKANPQWAAEIKGKREFPPPRICWGNPEVSDAVAAGVIAKLDKEYVPSLSLSPEDGAAFCECSKCTALDANDRDPSMDCISITDRYVHFCNRIAEKVTKKYPDVLLGFLAYVQYTRPPVREKVHPNLIPEIAPITYCRAHTMNDPTCPSRQSIRTILEGWAKKAPAISYYNYMYHLAELSAPYPMMKQMSEELPIIYANNVKFWQPETAPHYEAVLPGMVLTIRMSWAPKSKPSEILDEFFDRFYGAASTPMRKYWQIFDDAWIKVPEHAGCGFGYPRRFTPQVMKAARETMDAALAACKTPMEKRRVKMSDESLRQFELFMKLRWDLFEGRLANIGQESDQWLNKQLALSEEYAPQSAFGKTYWTKNTHAGEFFKQFFQLAYHDAARIAKNYQVISEPIRKWHYAVDKEKKAATANWVKPDFDDRSWQTTDPCIDTWASLDLPAYYGPMWYRTKVRVPSVPSGKKVYLWVSSTDGNCKVFINGQHIPYVNDKNEKSDEFSGFCNPASFDITPAIKPGGENQITIIGTHTFINEIGTGGLLGPVYLYREK